MTEKFTDQRDIDRAMDAYNEAQGKLPPRKRRGIDRLRDNMLRLVGEKICPLCGADLKDPWTGMAALRCPGCGQAPKR